MLWERKDNKKYSKEIEDAKCRNRSNKNGNCGKGHIRESR